MLLLMTVFIFASASLNLKQSKQGKWHNKHASPFLTLWYKKLAGRNGNSNHNLEFTMLFTSNTPTAHKHTFLVAASVLAPCVQQLLPLLPHQPETGRTAKDNPVKTLISSSKIKHTRVRSATDTSRQLIRHSKYT